MGRRGVTSRGAGGGCWTCVAANVVAVNLTDLSVQNWGTIREARESLTHTSSPLPVTRPLNRANAAAAASPFRPAIIATLSDVSVPSDLLLIDA